MLSVGSSTNWIPSFFPSKAMLSYSSIAFSASWRLLYCTVAVPRERPLQGMIMARSSHTEGLVPDRKIRDHRAYSVIIKLASGGFTQARW